MTKTGWTGPICAALLSASLFTYAYGKDSQEKQVGSSPPAFSSYVAPFDYHGIRLGSTMAEFYAAAPPVFSNYEKGYEKDGHPYCSDQPGDPPAQVFPDPIDLSHGGGSCAWFYNGRSSGPVASSLQIGVARADIWDFRYIAMPGEQQGKLYQVTIVFTSNGFQGIVDALTSKFGPPTEVKTQKWENPAGGTFDNDVVVWRNRVSSITVMRMDSDMGNGRLEYILNDHYNYKVHLTRKASGGNAAAK